MNVRGFYVFRRGIAITFAGQKLIVAIVAVYLIVF